MLHNEVAWPAEVPPYRRPDRCRHISSFRTSPLSRARRTVRTRCSNNACELEAYEDDSPHTEGVPTCPRCNAILRPDVVMFEEMIPAHAEWTVKKALRECDLFLAIGTSGTVSPASNFVRSAEFGRARTVLVNLEPMRPRHPAFDEEYLGRAEELLPVLLATT